MIKIIQKFFSNKRNVRIVAILFILAVGAATYTLLGIQKNVAQLADETEGEPYFPAYPTINMQGKAPALVQQIQRGEYLVKAGDCIACHTNTPEKGLAFAGGLPMETPFGVIYTPNITPSKKTGIGLWTEAQFIKAMHDGISPSGSQYYPAFPYLYFNKVTVQDLIDMKVYLDHLPAIEQKNRPNKMVWPFNLRFLQSGWRLLFFQPNKTGPLKPDPKQSPEWNRGAYLVEGLGHCAMCHTPSYYILNEKYSLGAPIRKYSLTGAKIQGYLAPNISKYNLDHVSPEELIQVFTHNRLIGGGAVEGPMLEANQNSLKYLTRSDLLSIATYLKSVQSKMPPKPKAGSGGIGKAIYEGYCTGCHASGAGGAPKYGDPVSWSVPLKSGLDTLYKNAIDGINGMPAKGTCLTCADDEIKAAVNYMLASLAGKSSKPVPVVKKLTLQDGKMIYDRNCAVCHNSGFKNAPKIGDKSAWQPYVDQGFLNAYLNVITGKKGHLIYGGCLDCSDAAIKAAIQYLMTESSDQNYSLW